MFSPWIRSILIPIALAFVSWGANADEPQYSLKVGESVDIGRVFWVTSHCDSMLTGFGGVDLLEGPPGIELSIREEGVTDKTQRCLGKIPGGMVVLTAKAIPSKFIGTIRYRVRFKTRGGDTQASYSRNIALYPN